MTLALSIVDAYRKRKFRDLARDWKPLSRQRLDALVAKLDPAPKFVYKPFDHQLVGFLLALMYPGLFLTLDMGVGKSKIMLDVFSYRRRLTNPDQRARRMLVLVPNRTNVWGWEEQIRTHAPWLSYGLLSDEASAAERKAIWADTSLNVVVATYAGLIALHKIGKEISAERVTRTGALFDTIVADESAAIRNPQSKAFQILSQLAHLVRFRYPMTGTPFTKDPLGLWSQFYFADPDDTPLTSDYHQFRTMFFTPIKTAFNIIYALPVDKREALHKVIRHLSIRYEESECNSLPDKMGGLANPICIPIHLHGQQAEYVRQTYAEVQGAAKGDAQVVGAFHRLRRAASGYIEIPGMGEFREFESNPKLDACMDLLEEMDTSQCIIVAYYQETIRIIERRLQKEAEKKGERSKFTYAKVVGGQADSAANVSAFQAGKVRLLLLSTAGARGLNLQNCRYMIIFESPVSPEDAQQVEKRIHRTGQKERVHIYHLVAPVDVKLLDGLREDKQLLDIIMDGVTNVV